VARAQHRRRYAGFVAKRFLDQGINAGFNNLAALVSEVNVWVA